MTDTPSQDAREWAEKINPHTVALGGATAWNHVLDIFASFEAHLRTPAGEAGEMVRPRDHWDADWWKPEPSDPFWMLEAEDGEWLKNRDSLLGTRDATKAIRFPTEETAMAHPARMKPGSKWWDAKATEHLWCDFPETATRLSATDTQAMRPNAAEAVNQWFAEWQASESKHWGDKIAWSTAFTIAARIDALTKGK